MNEYQNSKLFKVLSRNDTGETHSHQSGISIPKKVAFSGIFPRLGTDVLNPRVDVKFYDDNDNPWNFQYIFYNDIFFGKPSGKGHNEYRLTCVKDYIRENKIKAGDSIWFMIDDNNVRRIGFEKAQTNEEEKNPEVIVIKMTSTWKIIKY